jgi:hypothetical protein
LTRGRAILQGRVVVEPKRRPVMSENQTPGTTENSVETASKSIVGTLLELGSTWASHGLHAGKFSLENGARALEKTAKTLESLAKELERKTHKNQAA